MENWEKARRTLVAFEFSKAWIDAYMNSDGGYWYWLRNHLRQDTSPRSLRQDFDIYWQVC